MTTVQNRKYDPKGDMPLSESHKIVKVSYLKKKLIPVDKDDHDNIFGL